MADASVCPCAVLGGAHHLSCRQHLGLRDVRRELADVARRRVRDDLLGRADLVEHPVLHDRDAIAEAQRLVEVVGDEHHRPRTALLHRTQLVLHVAPDQRIEGGERLVEEEHLGVEHERPRQADALLHAAGQLLRVVVRPRAEPDRLEHRRRLLAPRRLGDTRCTSRP